MPVPAPATPSRARLRGASDGRTGIRKENRRALRGPPTRGTISNRNAHGLCRSIVLACEGATASTRGRLDNVHRLAEAFSAAYGIERPGRGPSLSMT